MCKSQPARVVQVFQGERQFCKDNMRLGGFTLGPIPPAPRGVPQIDVGFYLDANGILSVTAKDLGTKRKETITINNSKGRLSDDEIEKMIRDAKKFADSDKKAKVRMEAKQALENLLRSIESSLKDEVEIPSLAHAPQTLFSLWLSALLSIDAQNTQRGRESLPQMRAPLRGKCLRTDWEIAGRVGQSGGDGHNRADQETKILSPEP